MRELKVYNTLTREKEPFTPVTPGQVKMYVCGITPYNHSHMGNARPFVTWDVIKRYLEHLGYEVTHIQNFTDVDDKIINAAIGEGVSWDTISNRYIASYFEVMDALHVRHADKYPRVSEHMPEIIHMVEKLIAKGYAYVIDHDVYYSVEKFDDYGELSGRSLDDMMAGARIEVDDRKHNPMDFALWKGAKPGEPSWDSPWGKGRPGWHIECSVMAKHHLGETIDIHAGGEDLVFPHHENEIAQSEAANGKPFAKYWLHNGFITVDNEKMSKSLGNFFTVRDIAAQFPYEVIRFFILNGHYRSPINFSRELMQACQNGLERIKNARKELAFFIKNKEDSDLTAEEQQKLQDLEQYKIQFEAAMDDDFNTADAISVIYELVRDSNIAVKANVSKAFAIKMQDMLDHLCNVMGVAEIVEDEISDEETAKIEALIAKRTEAKKAKDFAAADAIRDELAAMGITIKDTRQGVQWFRG